MRVPQAQRSRRSTRPRFAAKRASRIYEHETCENKAYQNKTWLSSRVVTFVLSRAAHARIEQVAQRVSEHIGGVNDDGETKARRQRQPRSLEHEGAARSRQHAAPGRRRWRHAETEERQARLGKDHS